MLGFFVSIINAKSAKEECAKVTKGLTKFLVEVRMRSDFNRKGRKVRMRKGR